MGFFTRAHAFPSITPLSWSVNASPIDEVEAHHGAKDIDHGGMKYGSFSALPEYRDLLGYRQKTGWEQYRDHVVQSVFDPRPSEARKLSSCPAALLVMCITVDWPKTATDLRGFARISADKVR